MHAIHVHPVFFLRIFENFFENVLRISIRKTFYYRATVIKTVCLLLAQKIYIDQWDRKESLELNPPTYDHLIYDKGGKNISGEKTVSLISGAGRTG